MLQRWMMWYYHKILFVPNLIVILQKRYTHDSKRCSNDWIENAFKSRTPFGENALQSNKHEKPFSSTHSKLFYDRDKNNNAQKGQIIQSFESYVSRCTNDYYDIIRNVILSNKNIRQWMNTRLLWWHIKRNSPEVNTSVGVDARNNREDSRAFWSSFSQTSQPKYYCSFILSDNLMYKKWKISENSIS